MAFVLEFDEKAEIEFHEAYDSYEEQLAGLGGVLKMQSRNKLT